MCCIFSILVFLGPRFGLIFWYLYQPGRFDRVFDGWVLPVLGWAVLPWTTLMWVAVGVGGVSGIDWLWIGWVCWLIFPPTLVADGATRTRSTPTPPSTCRAKSRILNHTRPWRYRHGRWPFLARFIG